jgi:hypothetical protein
MRMRVYAPRFGDILTGRISEEEYEEANRYTKFFNNNSVSGEGFYELKMTTLESRENQERELVARFNKDGFEVGYYGHEGWHPCTSTDKRVVGDTTVVFDSMIPYYFLQSERYQDKNYEPEPTKETILSQILDKDESFFLQVVEERRETREE